MTLQLLISGISLGSVYALIAVGFAIVFSILRFSNFAHGGKVTKTPPGASPWACFCIFFARTKSMPGSGAGSPAKDGHTPPCQSTVRTHSGRRT